MGPSWCEEERLLASIFRFPHKGWQDMQADTATNEFRSMLCDLLEQLVSPPCAACAVLCSLEACIP